MWIIKPAGLYVSIAITVTSLATESGYDYLYLLDGGSTDAPLLPNGALDGTGADLVFSTNGPQAVVSFITDQAVTAAGFTLVYTAQECYQGCSGYGSCVNNACRCNAGHYGQYCQLTHCCTTGSCGSHGTCLAGACECQCAAS